MRAKKVNFIFVEKEPLFKRIARGFSDSSLKGSKYGYSVHGFETDTPKYKLNDQFKKQSRKPGVSRPIISDEVLLASAGSTQTGYRSNGPVETVYSYDKSNNISHSVSTPAEVPIRHVHREDGPIAPSKAFNGSRSKAYAERNESYSNIKSDESRNQEIADKLSAAFDDSNAGRQPAARSASSARVNSSNARANSQGAKTSINDVHQEASEQRTRPQRNRRNSGIKFTDKLLLLVDNLRAMRKTVIRYGAGSAFGIVLVVAVSLIIVNSHAFSISVAGQSIGFVTDEKQYAQLIEDVKTQISAENMNATIIIDDEQVALTGKGQGGTDFIESDQLMENLVASGAVKAEAYAINVDNQNYANLATEEEATALLQEIVNRFVGEEDASYKWQNDIQIEKAVTPLDAITTTGSAIDVLLTGGEESAPVVKLESVSVTTEKENIDFKTVEETSDTLYKGETETKQKGIDGKKKITRQIKSVNGEVVENEVLETETLSEPTTEIILVGTKEKPVAKTQEKTSATSSANSSSSANKKSTTTSSKSTSSNKSTSTTKSTSSSKSTSTKSTTTKSTASSDKKSDSSSSSKSSSDSGYSSTKGESYIGGSGTLSNPMKRMELSSPFGGGRNHKGADFRNPKGTPIYAAKSGKVISAGYSGSYGYCIIIRHGNGLDTLYSHCNKLNVKKGQKVSTGEQIATVGMTGRATGYHLHFEVRVNGKQVNPMKYL